MENMSGPIKVVNPTMKRILVLDDDKELCELLVEFLAGEGFSPTSLNHPAMLLDGFKDGVYDLLIIDVMLPETNGFDVLKQIRSKSSVPIIMLTARGEELDRILGLELGADDYLPKPFSPRELAARIRAVFRRFDMTSATLSDELIQVGDVCVHLGSRRVSCGKEDVTLTGVEFRLLEIFLRSAGKVLKRQDLAMQVLERQLAYEDRSLDVHVSNLRKKIDGKAAHSGHIQTVRGIGYVFTVPS
ncbi:MAG: response regulator transcription factor [Candidatus Ozemobacteraceae bacterium]